ENSVGPDGRLLFSVVAEWTAPGVRPMVGDPLVDRRPWDEGFERWRERMADGEAIIGSVADFPTREAADLHAQGIVSLAYYPVTVDGEWWGCVGFDDCQRERDWSTTDLDVLRTATALIGAAIARQRNDHRARETEARYRSVVERVPAVTYVDTMEGSAALISFVSPQIEALLGYPQERFLDDADFWFELVHPDDRDRVEAAGRAAGRGGLPFEEEYRMRHADGRWVWVHDTSTPVRDDDGLVTHFQGFTIDITQRKEAEHRLLDAESRYRGVVEAIPAVTYIDETAPTADAGYSARLSFVSPQIESMLGHPSSRYVDDPDFWFSLIHPDDLSRMEALNVFDVHDLTPFDQTYRMRHASGRWVWVHDTSTAVFAPDGSLAYFQGFMVDVTAQKETERRMASAEERFRVLVEQLPAFIYLERVEPGSTQAVGMDYVSPYVETMLGYPTSAWLDSVGFWEQIILDEDREQALSAIDHVNGTGEPLSIDYRLRAADGHVVWVHEEAVLLRDADGTPVSWQGFLLDVTERNEAEERLRIAEERYRTIVEHTPVITYQEAPVFGEYVPETTFPYVSPQVESLLGYDHDAWISTPGLWAQVTHPDDLPAVLAESQRTNETGEHYRQDYRVFAADGRTVWIHDEAHLIRDGEGHPLVWQGVMVDITERKEAEERYRHAQERLQALVEHMPAVVYTESPDADPAKFYVSPQVEQIFGFTPEEWTWTNDFWIDHVHPEDREAVQAADRASASSHAQYQLDYRFRCADGSYVWVHDEAVWVPTSDDDGFWQGFLFDVTAQKDAEAQLVEAERMFRVTVEHLPAVVYREAPDANVDDFYIGPQVETVFGYTPEQWRETPGFWTDHLHPADRERVVEANRRANASRETFSEEYRFRRADGTFAWIHDDATYVGDLGAEAWWQGFMLDITERKEAEQQLREAEEMFRTIVEHNPAVIYTQEFDPNDPGVSRTTYISPRQPEMLGYSVEEVLADGTLWTRILHPEDRERVLSADVHSNSGEEENFSLAYRMIHKDGRIVWVQDDARLVEIEGRPAFWQGFMMDITERKQAEEQLERALEVEREATGRLRALDDMKNTFLQAVSHDLRTPLAAILGLAITLERGDVHLPEDDARDLARRIAGNARRLERLVTNLLDLDRLSRGIVTPKLETTDVGGLVQRVLSESELVADSRLRPRIESVVVPADPAKVERIVENLLANAGRHTPATSTIWVGVRAVADGVLISVEDDGPGVPEEIRDAIFEPFQQGDDAPAHSPGVGVGLTLVRRFAELHGGQAWVEEREGGGASFRVFLPSAPAGAP
ncbi:MAG: PAS domain-containing protein, partial [Actinomycetota bacterium]